MLQISVLLNMTRSSEKRSGAVVTLSSKINDYFPDAKSLKKTENFSAER